ncbi:hypothetical protein [Methylobacterium sp. JK268]
MAEAHGVLNAAKQGGTVRITSRAARGQEVVDRMVVLGVRACAMPPKRIPRGAPDIEILAAPQSDEG